MRERRDKEMGTEVRVKGKKEEDRTEKEEMWK
jgi:hypothetical protein